MLSIFIATGSTDGQQPLGAQSSDNKVLTTALLTCRHKGTLLSILATNVTFDMFWFR